MKRNREARRGKPRRQKKVARSRVRAPARRRLPKFSRKVFRRVRRSRGWRRLARALRTARTVGERWGASIGAAVGGALRWLGERLHQAGDALTRLHRVPAVEIDELRQPAIKRKVRHRRRAADEPTALGERRVDEVEDLAEARQQRGRRRRPKRSAAVLPARVDRSVADTSAMRMSSKSPGGYAERNRAAVRRAFAGIIHRTGWMVRASPSSNPSSSSSARARSAGSVGITGRAG